MAKTKTVAVKKVSTKKAPAKKVVAKIAPKKIANNKSKIAPYKSKKNEKKEFFIYKPKPTKDKKLKEISKNSPFEKLSELRFR